MGSENTLSDINLTPDKEEYSQGDEITVGVKFSIQGGLRDAFNEKNWTESYNKYDNVFKLKYGIKLASGGFRKHELKTVDTYRKASLFWTRNPKLVNPMKEKRVWVQVAKNFEPIIRLTEDEVRQELFDFEEKLTFKASELGAGKHKIGAEVFASWQKHHYTEPDSVKSSSNEIEIKIN
ncbi:MAG: hypothetical protein EPO62_03665 [Candidatus Nitrosotenuis sp.]|nr:MAG: hypothetical protein EPO62_03665 [Candidatus Nitrosotenuis sp.]